MTARIGILGGSFDPPHNAHVALARLFSDSLKLDRLIVVPAGSPWQKDELHTSREDRLAMLELAFADHTHPVDIDARELERDGPSYTADTLTELRKELGSNVCLIFLMGADQFLGLPSWNAWPYILDLANFAVAGRPGVELDPAGWPEELKKNVSQRVISPSQLGQPSGSVVLIPADLGAVSSSQVRELLGMGAHNMLADLLPSPVLDHIRERGLYLS